MGEFAGVEAPDAIVVVADATTLERSLPMIAEVLLLGRPVLLALTMIDELKARGIVDPKDALYFMGVWAIESEQVKYSPLSFLSMW